MAKKHTKKKKQNTKQHKTHKKGSSSTAGLQNKLNTQIKILRESNNIDTIRE